MFWDRNLLSKVEHISVEIFMFFSPNLIFMFFDRLPLRFSINEELPTIEDLGGSVLFGHIINLILQNNGAILCK